MRYQQSTGCWLRNSDCETWKHACIAVEERNTTRRKVKGQFLNGENTLQICVYCRAYFSRKFGKSNFSKIGSDAKAIEIEDDGFCERSFTKKKLNSKSDGQLRIVVQFLPYTTRNSSIGHQFSASLYWMHNSLNYKSFTQNLQKKVSMHKVFRG